MLTVVSESGRAAELLDLVSRAGVRLRERLGVKVDAVPAVLESVRASQPASSDARRLYAEGLARLRRFDALGARGLLERAVQADARFPLAHAALARTWSTLGYDARAREAAERAFELSSGLARADRLQVEGTYREMDSAWPEAIEIWQTLANFFPDDVEHALRLANAQIASGAAREGLATIEGFRVALPGDQGSAARAGRSRRGRDALGLQEDGGRRRRGGSGGRAPGCHARRGLGAPPAGRRRAAIRVGETRRSRFFENAKALYVKRPAIAPAWRARSTTSRPPSPTGRTRGGPRRSYEEGLAIARAVGEQDLVARFLSNLAIQERRAGNLQASLRMNQESLAIRREIGDRINAAISLNNIGNVLLDMGNLSAASEHYEQSAVAEPRDRRSARSGARARTTQAESLRLQGQSGPRASHGRARRSTIRRGIDDPASVATSLFGVGARPPRSKATWPAGARLLTEGLEMDRKLNRRRPMAYALYFLGEIALVQGDLGLARRRHQEALDMRTALGEKGTAAESRAALAVLALEEGQPANAEALAREAIAVFEGQMANDNEANARAVLALALVAQGRQPAAAREASRARALVRESQNAMSRLPVTIAAARVEAATAPRDGDARPGCGTAGSGEARHRPRGVRGAARAGRGRAAHGAGLFRGHAGVAAHRRGRARLHAVCQVSCLRHDHHMPNRLRVLAVLFIAFAAIPAAQSPSASEEVTRLREAVTIVDEVMKGADTAIPDTILKRAEGIAVFPGTDQGRLHLRRAARARRPERAHRQGLVAARPS